MIYHLVFGFNEILFYYFLEKIPEIFIIFGFLFKFLAKKKKEGIRIFYPIIEMKNISFSDLEFKVLFEHMNESYN